MNESTAATGGEPAPRVVDDRIADMYSVESSDPDSRLIDRADLGPDDVRQINELMNALGTLREAENALSEASRRYMRLNETDMRALHFLIVCGHRGELATPGAIAAHLHISTASTTKLLDRLERDGHVVRSPHPRDRRALVISVTAATHEAAMETVGRQHAGRFVAAARLTPEQRETVIAFVRDMTSALSLSGVAWASRAE